MNEIKLPIDKLSYSSLTQLLRNPLIFKLKEILKVYDTKMSVSGTIGSAVHESLKFYYGGNKDFPCPKNPNEARPLAKEFGLKWLSEQSDDNIRYGKTGSREDLYKGFTQSMDFYFAEEPEYHEILIVEEKLEGELKTYDGDTLPIPAVGKPDIVVRQKNGDIEIIDIKTTIKFTDYTNEDGEPHEDYMKIMQAMFMDHLLIASKGLHAKRVIFREVKRTVNSKENAGKPQLRDWVVPLDHEPYRIIFYNLYKDVVKFLMNDPIFLPNFSDQFDGEHSGFIYAQGLINADMSDVEVVHKVRDIAFASKKFVSSRLDSAINKDLLPEERVKVKLAEFGIPIEPVETKKSASVVQYRFKVSAGVRMTTIQKHHADIVKALEVKGDVRILAPIPGTSLLGIEVENAKRSAAILSKEYLTQNTLTIPIGLDVNDEVVKVPLNAMPHLLVAGTTGSGKSTFLHSTLHALTEQMKPEDMRLILIDPKRVELASFKKKPHLEGKVIYEYEDAVKALLKLVDEMEDRYRKLEDAEVRDIMEYNAGRRSAANKLPYIVMVVDEFSDFMIRSRSEAKKKRKVDYDVLDINELVEVADKVGIKIPGRISRKAIVEALDRYDSADVELLIVRIAQMARAVGIHLILATQRPSADVITGLIRSNMPTRISFSTASAVESGVIGIPGADKLAGKGDALFSYPQNRGIVRLQGFIHKV